MKITKNSNEHSASEVNKNNVAHKIAACGNCATELMGDYCHTCGQSAVVHNSIPHLLHELLHGIFHFDAKAWRTIIDLFIRPGKMTNEYIQGRRKKYVSPISLFLFLMILLFLTFAITSQPSENPAKNLSVQAEQLKAIIVHLQLPSVNSESREHFFDVPELALYKLKGTAFKFAFLLIPISLPFLWLLFATKKRFSLFDHAVFSLYSLSFVITLIVLMMVTERIGLGINPIAVFFVLLIPHLFFHLRGTYQLTTLESLWRTAAVLVVANTALVLYLIFILMVQTSL